MAAVSSWSRSSAGSASDEVRRDGPVCARPAGRGRLSGHGARGRCRQCLSRRARGGGRCRRPGSAPRTVELPPAIAPGAPRAGRPARRLPHLPGQPPLRRPGRLHPPPDPRAGGAGPLGRGPLRPAVARGGRRGGLHPGSRPRPLPRARPLPGPAPPGVLTTAIDALEFAVMCTAGFGEPWAYSLRARRLLAARRDEFDLVHDNQCLGSGMLGMVARRVAAAHHPAPPDHRRPPAGPRPRHQPLAEVHHRGGGSASCACRSGWPGGCRPVVTVSESSRTGHRRPDGGGPRAHDGGPGRGRPHRLPPVARRGAGARAASW